MIESLDPTEVPARTAPARGLGRLARAGQHTRWLRPGAMWVLAVGLVCCIASPASAAPVSRAAGRVTFGIEPSSAGGADGRPDLSFGVTPGAVLRDHVAVLNYSSVALSLQLYATDAIETAAGGFGLLPATAKPTGAGAWISLPRRDETVSVPPQSAKAPGQVVVPLVVRIPDNATPGDHAGGIVASLRTVGKNSSGQNVILVQRVGTRVFVRVAGRLSPRLSVSDLRAGYGGTLNPIGQGHVTVSYLLTNAGNVDLAVDQSISVSGLLGSTRHLDLVAVPLLLPGTSLHERVVVPGVWPQFRLQAKVSAVPHAPVGASAAGLVPVTETTGLWAIPWPLIALVALVLLAVFAALRARANLTARRLARTPQVVRA